uniref:Uncharacterized protein n=1 Tax=Glossina morsitans morsitans TaxID=37546 RepID=A0ABK9NGJ9_GLOMM
MIKSINKYGHRQPFTLFILSCFSERKCGFDRLNLCPISIIQF